MNLLNPSLLYCIKLVYQTHGEFKNQQRSIMIYLIDCCLTKRLELRSDQSIQIQTLGELGRAPCEISISTKYKATIT